MNGGRAKKTIVPDSPERRKTRLFRWEISLVFCLIDLLGKGIACRMESLSFNKLYQFPVEFIALVVKQSVTAVFEGHKPGISNRFILGDG